MNTFSTGMLFNNKFPFVVNVLKSVLKNVRIKKEVTGYSFDHQFDDELNNFKFSGFIPVEYVGNELSQHVQNNSKFLNLFNNNVSNLFRFVEKYGCFDLCSLVQECVFSKIVVTDVSNSERSKNEHVLESFAESVIKMFPEHVLFVKRRGPRFEICVFDAVFYDEFNNECCSLDEFMKSYRSFQTDTFFGRGLKNG